MNSGLRIRQLGSSDIAFAQRLRSAAGWNQTVSDWVRLLDYEPSGCFAGEVDEQPVATTTTTTYGTDLAWIGMVLVDSKFRRRGIATAMLEHCLKVLLNDRGVNCVKLDATPAGAAVYEKLGFRVDCELARWEASTPRGRSREWPAAEYDSFRFRDLDEKAFGANRIAFLDRLARDSSHCLSVDAGFGMFRSGERAGYLGPVVSSDTATAESLIESLLTSSGQAPAFWDIPEGNASAVELARRLGFHRQRRLIRMWTGQVNVPGDTSLQWAIGGPETG